MRQELNNIEKIDLYITNQLNKEELAEFEAELNQNPELTTKVDEHQLLIQAIKRQQLKKEILAVANGGSFWNFWTKLGLTIGLASLIIIGIIQLPSKANKIKNVEKLAPSITQITPKLKANNVKVKEAEPAIFNDTSSFITTLKTEFSSKAKIKTSIKRVTSYKDVKGLKGLEILKTTKQNHEINYSIKPKEIIQLENLENVKELLPFSSIHIKSGLDVELIYDSYNSIRIESDDDNIKQNILIENQEEKLIISYKRKKKKRKFFISFSSTNKTKKTAKIYITYNSEIKEIIVESSSAIESNQVIHSGNILNLETSSNSDLNLISNAKNTIIDLSSNSSGILKVNVDSLDISASSNSNLKINGFSKVLKVNSSSNSDINGKELSAEKSNIKASSNSSVTIYSTDEIIAESSSSSLIKIIEKTLNIINNTSLSGEIINGEK
jgi:hypothetical protein